MIEPTEAYKQGRAAYRVSRGNYADFPRCPYETSSQESLDWYDGFNDASDEDDE